MITTQRCEIRFDELHRTRETESEVESANGGTWDSESFWFYQTVTLNADNAHNGKMFLAFLVFICTVRRHVSWLTFVGQTQSTWMITFEFHHVQHIAQQNTWSQRYEPIKNAEEYTRNAPNIFPLCAATIIIIKFCSTRDQHSSVDNDRQQRRRRRRR